MIFITTIVKNDQAVMVSMIIEKTFLADIFSSWLVCQYVYKCVIISSLMCIIVKHTCLNEKEKEICFPKGQFVHSIILYNVWCKYIQLPCYMHALAIV